MLRELKSAITFALTTMLLFGGAYPLALWAIGWTAFASQSTGSLITRPDGTIAGSRLIAQRFNQPRYFHPRPSAVGYNAASTGGSNYGPSNPDHLKTVQERIDAVMARESVTAGEVPSEMVTAGGGGLDPHIPPVAAELQVRRVAAARGVAPERVRDVMRAHIETPLFGVLGRERINVLELNVALDASLGNR